MFDKETANTHIVGIAAVAMALVAMALVFGPQGPVNVDSGYDVDYVTGYGYDDMGYAYDAGYYVDYDYSVAVPTAETILRHRAWQAYQF